jgi:hypothetical protein
MSAWKPEGYPCYMQAIDLLNAIRNDAEARLVDNFEGQLATQYRDNLRRAPGSYGMQWYSELGPRLTWISGKLTARELAGLKRVGFPTEDLFLVGIALRARATLLTDDGGILDLANQPYIRDGLGLTILATCTARAALYG